jgi:hypothetical protein
MSLVVHTVASFSSRPSLIADLVFAAVKAA